MTEEYVYPFNPAVLKSGCEQSLTLLPAIFMTDNQVLSWKLYIFRFYDRILFRVLCTFIDRFCAFVDRCVVYGCNTSNVLLSVFALGSASVILFCSFLTLSFTP